MLVRGLLSLLVSALQNGNLVPPSGGVKMVATGTHKAGSRADVTITCTQKAWTPSIYAAVLGGLEEVYPTYCWRLLTPDGTEGVPVPCPDEAEEEFWLSGIPFDEDIPE